MEKFIRQIVNNPLFRAVLLSLLQQWARKLGPRSAAVGTGLLGLLAGVEACAVAFELPWWVHLVATAFGGAATTAFGVAIAVHVGQQDPTNPHLPTPADIERAKRNAVEISRQQIRDGSNNSY